MLNITIVLTITQMPGQNSSSGYRSIWVTARHSLLILQIIKLTQFKAPKKHKNEFAALK